MSWNWQWEFPGWHSCSLAQNAGNFINKEGSPVYPVTLCNTTQSSAQQSKPSQLLLSLEKLRLPTTNCSTSSCSPLPQERAHTEQQGGDAQNPKGKGG